MASENKTSCKRLGTILLVGLIAGICVEFYRRSRRPEPAPAEVQQQGLRLISRIVDRIEPTEFGQSGRGRLLVRKIRRMMAEGTIVLTHEIKPVGLYRTETFGPQTMYVKVLRSSSGIFTHVTEDQIAGAVFHEAVHAIKGGDSSIEEECDGYAAGLVASHLILGEETPVPLLIDGKPAAIYVRSQYSGLGHQPDYVPVGETPQWLSRMVGLER